MPVFNKVLSPHKKIFTQQDFLDGKCDKDGMPIKAPEAKGKDHGGSNKSTSQPVNSNNSNNRNSGS